MYIQTKKKKFFFKKAEIPIFLGNLYRHCFEGKALVEPPELHPGDGQDTAVHSIFPQSSPLWFGPELAMFYRLPCEEICSEGDHSRDGFYFFVTQAMESKLLVGGKNIVDHTNEQQKVLEQKRQEIAEQVIFIPFRERGGVRRTNATEQMSLVLDSSEGMKTTCLAPCGRL